MKVGLQLDGRLTIETFEDEKLVGSWVADNVICVAGLSDVASAISYLGVEDIANNIGVSPTVITPIYGAIGGGVTGTTFTTDTPSTADTQLSNEISRSTASAAAYAPALGSNPGQVVWQFQFPINNSNNNYTLTEAGVFVLASSVTNSGDMFDHALFTPNAQWLIGQSLVLSIQISLYATSW